MALIGRSRAGFILAGGKSSRMGRDKAFVDFGGQTLLQRALNVVGTVSDSVAIVGDPAKFAEYAGANQIVADIFPGCGPLGGIHTALMHSGADLNLMLAVDMPYVSVELLRFLFTMAEGTEAMITVPRAGRRLQPLCAVYRRGFYETAEAALKRGEYRIDAAWSRVSVRIVEEEELGASGFSERNFFNVNTPLDRLAGEGGG